MQGTVRMWIIVGPDGLVHDAKVRRSAGPLDSIAINAVRTWRFQPAMKDGGPVAVQIDVDVNFRLFR
jgi:protein TonB